MESTLLKLNDIVSSVDMLMGVKAVWGHSVEGVMCFGARGSGEAFYSTGRKVAEQAQTRPYFFAIGGGANVPAPLRGRVLELVKATGVYGLTTAFVQDELFRLKLEQWPVSVAISEVYSIEGEPLLIEDLGFPDRSILTNVFDRVARDEVKLSQLWRKLKNWPIKKRHDVSFLPAFRDPGKVLKCVSSYPKIDIRSEEGKRLWALSRAAERDRKLARAAKAKNKEKNKGLLICEACEYADLADAMFDAHHLSPLAAGVRKSSVDDLAVLCPTCHRYAHAKAGDPLTPLSVGDVGRARTKP